MIFAPSAEQLEVIDILRRNPTGKILKRVLALQIAAADGVEPPVGAP
ncbi:hypothetical protein KZX46_18550 [Polymorphobacter sp. PAMC 29334]|nr:hypothetical protein [Polymorphobacter sp. PAMC 29334]QYE34727.1 hypothetical protein KZX46_18550 [Polymorphobacter sp. PAMC 29334]